MRLFSGAPRRSPTGWFFVCENLFVFSGRPGGRPLQKILNFSVGANCVRPPLCAICVRFGRMQANSASLRGKFASQNRPSPTGWDKMCKNLFVLDRRGRRSLQGILRSVCHSERRLACPTADRSRSFVEGVSRSRRRSDTKPRSNATKGYGYNSRWLMAGMLHL